jgi:hypothetical protein
VGSSNVSSIIGHLNPDIEYSDEASRGNSRTTPAGNATTKAAVIGDIEVEVMQLN